MTGLVLIPRDYHLLKDRHFLFSLTIALHKNAKIL